MSFLNASRLGRIALVIAAAGCTDATKSAAPNGSSESSRLVLPDGSFNPALRVDTPLPATASIAGGAAAFSTAGATNVIVNGDFSSGITGWTRYASTGSGAWTTYSGAISPYSGYAVPAPPAGDAALVDMTGPGGYILYQTVTVPQSGVLSFDYFLANRYTGYLSGALSQCCTQVFRVDIMSTTAGVDDIGSGVLRNIYTTLPGTPLTTGYQRITADLSSLAGQTVRLRFAAGVWSFFFQVGIDNVSLVGNVNVAPTVSLPASYSTNEGQAVTVTATASDADNDALTYKWDIDNDGVVDSTTTTNSLSLTYGDNGSYPVKVTVDDANGHTASATTTVSVANVAPTITSISPAASISVGGTFNLNALFNDAGTNDGPFSMTIDWGDNTAATGNVASVGTPITAAHVYANYGVYTVKVTVKDKDGATSEPATVVVTTRDNTPAVITPTVTGTKVGDWYTSDVHVSFSVADPESGVASMDGCDAVTVSTDTPAAGKVITCTAKNGAGQTSTGSVTVKRDVTKPDVSLVGNNGTYTVDQTVNIGCSFADAASGIASKTCNGATGPAYSLGLGTHGVSATATDVAGHSRSVAGQFTVVATTGSVTALVKQWVSSADVIAGLSDKLAAAQASLNRGNTKAAGNQLDAFINQVNAQTGKSISADKAALLIAFANAMK